MLTQKLRLTAIALCSVFVVAVTGCSGGSDASATDKDTTVVQPATTTTATDTSMATDTSALDSASTRPVKSPSTPPPSN